MILKGRSCSSLIYAIKKHKVLATILSTELEKKRSLKKVFNEIQIVDWGVLPKFDFSCMSKKV